MKKCLNIIKKILYGIFLIIGFVPYCILAFVISIIASIVEGCIAIKQNWHPIEDVKTMIGILKDEWRKNKYR